MDKAKHRKDNKNSDVEPVDVLIPVEPCYWDITNMRLLMVMFGCSRLNQLIIHDGIGLGLEWYFRSYDRQL